MKKTITIISKIIVGLVIAILLFLAIVFLVNIVCSKMEQGKLETYGQSVTVDGKKMNVFIQGEGEETVVLLPGYGTAAPALDFKILVDELSPFYKVVVIEPFGYGLSDLTEKERSTENIVSEIAETMYANFKAAENLSFPKNLPVIFFIQANHPVTDRWIPEHKKQIEDSIHGKVMTFEGDHYLYRTKAKEIVENFREFMKEEK